MAFRLYLVPVVGTGTIRDPRRPKYFNSAADGTGFTGIITAGTPWGSIDYGFEPKMLVGANLIASDDTLISGESDVNSLPFDLTQLMTSTQVTNTQNILEAGNIPADWLNTTYTWQAMIRTVLGMFMFMQRYGTIYGQQNGGAKAPSWFAGGVTLDSTFGVLPAAVRTAITSTATDQGIPTTGLTAGTKLRVILKIIADHYQTQVYIFGPGFTI